MSQTVGAGNCPVLIGQRAGIGISQIRVGPLSVSPFGNGPGGTIFRLFRDKVVRGGERRGNLLQENRTFTGNIFEKMLGIFMVGADNIIANTVKKLGRPLLDFPNNGSGNDRFATKGPGCHISILPGTQAQQSFFLIRVEVPVHIDIRLCID